MNRADFIEYVSSKLYPEIDATPAEVEFATAQLERWYVINCGEKPCWDSIDRERVRDFILKNRG
jgi:hypothetical protein